MLQEELPVLAQRFKDVERFGLVLCQGAGAALSLDPSVAPLRELRDQAEPFFHLYFVDREGRPQVAGDDARPPSWLIKLAVSHAPAKKNSPVLLRPLPPGYSLAAVPSGMPVNYFAYSLPMADDGFLLLELDLGYLFGPWLRRQVARWGLDSSLQWEVLPWEPGQVVGEPRSDFSQTGGWSITMPTLLSDEVSTFGPLRIKVDNSLLLARLEAEAGSFLAAGLLVLFAFAFSLWSTTRALRKREEYSEAKSRFVSMVGHELRTPISAIEMYLEILRERLIEDPRKIEEYHAVLNRESKRLKRLVENLLTAGLAETGKLELRAVSLDLPELISEVLSRESAAAGRRVDWTAPSEPVRVKGDKDALDGVLTNLLHNAWKYSEPDSPVAVECVKGSKKVSVLVEDRGPGLPETADYETIFEPYYRAHQNSKGIGLGLALARLLTVAHEGRLTGRGRAGGGSVFTLELPLEEDAS